MADVNLPPINGAYAPMPHELAGIKQKYKVKFGSSRTASTTIQGSSPCKVTTPKGVVTLKGGEKIEIKDGKITIK